MLRDRAAPIDLFALVPALELRFEPELAELDRLLEDDELFEHVKAGLSRRWPHTTVTGRPSTPVEGGPRVVVIPHLDAGRGRWVTGGWIPFNGRRGRGREHPRARG